MPFSTRRHERRNRMPASKMIALTLWHKRRSLHRKWPILIDFDRKRRARQNRVSTSKMTDLTLRQSAEKACLRLTSLIKTTALIMRWARTLHSYRENGGFEAKRLAQLGPLQRSKFRGSCLWAAFLYSLWRWREQNESKRKTIRKESIPQAVPLNFAPFTDAVKNSTPDAWFHWPVRNGSTWSSGNLTQKLLWPSEFDAFSNQFRCYGNSLAL